MQVTENYSNLSQFGGTLILEYFWNQGTIPEIGKYKETLNMQLDWGVK